MIIVIIQKQNSLHSVDVCAVLILVMGYNWVIIYGFTIKSSVMFVYIIFVLLFLICGKF